MPKRDAAPVGAPCWFELFTHDTDKSREFYGSLFGWTSEEAGAEYGGYINFLKDGAPIAGCMKNDGSTGAPDAWSIYLATDDAQRTADDAAKQGATIIVPPMPVMDLGTMVVLADPGGAAIGGWQSGTHKGFTEYEEPNTPSWFELFAADYDKAVAFYRDVFTWTTQVEGDSPEFRYTTLTIGDEQFAGIMDASSFLPDGVPAHWSVYFRVDDADKALAQVADLGGAIVQPAEDTPYGRLATASDSNGVPFKLRSVNQ